MERGIFERHSSGQKRKRSAHGEDTSTSADQNSRGAIVISVVENRGREVCICRMDTSNVRYLKSLF